MYIFGFHVPESHLESVKKAVFEAGAGKIGNYDQASWQTLGEAQFRPLPGSNPYLGTHGTLEKVPEFKVQTVCEKGAIPAVIAALKLAHPYETPWYYVLKSEVTIQSS